MIYQICDVMMSINTWDGAFLNVSFEPQLNQVTKLGQLIDISKGDNFKESLEQYGGLGLSSSFFSI